MREILFRGWFECITGVSYWVYGYLNKQSNGNWEIINGEDEWTVSNVGQFTGLFDKGGKRIFEGDIVSSDWPVKTKSPIEINDNHEVYYSIHMAAFVIAIDKEISEKKYKDIIYLTKNRCEKSLQVIGNIHENKELITKCQ